MAGAMRKMAVYLGLVEDDQYDDEYMYGDGAADTREREEARPAPARADRYSDRPEATRQTDTVRVTEREDDDLARRRATAERPTRDWRTETVANEPVSSHPAGSRAKQARPAAPKVGVEGLKITTLHPRSYNDARRIGEEFRSGTPVIMNLTELDDTDAKRIVDFAAGLVFGLRGSIERVTNKVFMLSPANVQVGAEQARAQLEQDGATSHR